MLEKRFAAVPPQNLVADGGADGSVQIADTSLFKVKQRVVVVASTQTNLELEVKKIVSSTVMVLGPVGGSIISTTNLSAYTVLRGANVFANEQKRPAIGVDEVQRAVYEEEPTVANRVVMVDKHGQIYDENNPLPAAFTGSVSVGEIAQGEPSTLDNAWPTKLTDGTDTLAINADGSIDVNVKGQTSGTIAFAHNEVTSISSGIESTVLSFTAPQGGVVLKSVDVSGDNIALFKVKVDGVTVVNKRTWWTNLNQTFNIDGLRLSPGQVLSVTVVHDRPYLGAFEATALHMLNN